MTNGNRICPAACVLMLLVSGPSGALELTKAGFPKNTPGSVSGRADMEFSNVLAVKNITFKKNAVVMPVTVYKDRTYADIKLLSKSLYMKIQACFAGGECSSGAGAAVPVIKVEEMKPLKSKTRVANAGVSFDGDLKAVFGVMKNREGELWVAYPSNFEVKDATLKSTVAKAVKEAYTKASGKPR